MKTMSKQRKFDKPQVKEHLRMMFTEQAKAGEAIFNHWEQQVSRLF